jgi:signal transduction histidine kinase
MDLVESILSSVDRCGSITKSLLNFAGHLEVKFQLIDLGKIINNVLILLGRDAEKKSIELVVKIEEGISKIESDQSHLQQIFLNILNNIFEALKKGGRLEIQVEKQENKSIKVVFTDDRPHIPEKDLKRIFDPFFSTKGKRVGTGLGLPITYGLVQEIGGSINVKSVPDQGTSFIIILPLKMERTVILYEESMTIE